MPAKPSSWSKFPTDENPWNKYKFGSVNLFLSAGKMITERSTYNILEWLGDVGGLFDALRYLGLFFVSPYVAFTYKAKMLFSLFRFVKS